MQLDRISVLSIHQATITLYFDYCISLNRFIKRLVLRTISMHLWHYTITVLLDKKEAFHFVIRFNT